MVTVYSSVSLPSPYCKKLVAWLSLESQAKRWSWKIGENQLPDAAQSLKKKKTKEAVSVSGLPAEKCHYWKHSVTHGYMNSPVLV